MDKPINIMKNKKGFTLIEVLSFSIILLFILTAIFATYVVFTEYANETLVQANMQNQARVAVERIGRDIRLANVVTCTATTLNITFDPTRLGQVGTAWTSRYTLNGTDLIYIPDITNMLNQIIIADNVILNLGDVLFQMDNTRDIVTITVDLRVEQTVFTTSRNFRLTTIAGLRNG